MSETSDIARARGVLGLTGAAAGLGVWALVDLLPDLTDNARLILALSSLLAGFFVPLLAMIGPLPVSRAAIGAIIVAVPLAVLMTTASLRFDEVEPFIETGHPIFALVLCVSLPIPFLIAGLSDRQRWLDYPVLFDAAWNVFVRASAAILFTGLFWGILLLSHALLNLVGVEVIEWLLEIEPVPYVLTGLMLGLGAAVANELSDYVSPHLPLRLLRLLLPVVFVVTLIFLIALPLTGLSGLFGNLSVAATLVGMSFAAATLVTSALDRDDAAAVDNRVMRLSAMGLALMVPAMSALAVYSVTERVSQYGWSPDRLAAMTAAVLMAGYGITYAGSVLVRREWMERIRQANALMALGALAMAAAWLSPLLNPQKLSVASQVARYEQGAVIAEELDLWSIGREWGRAGEAALDRLARMETPEQDVLGARLTALAEAHSRYEFETAAPPAKLQELSDRLRALLPVRPEGARLPEAVLAGQSVQHLERMIASCGATTPAGNPGCIAVMADLVEKQAGDEVVIFLLEGTRYVRSMALSVNGLAMGRFGPTWIARSTPETTSPDLIDRIASGDYTIGAPRVRALKIGEAELILLP